MAHGVGTDSSEEASAPLHADTIDRLLANQAAFKGFLRRHLPSDAAVEDLLQQSLLKAIRNADGLADKESATAWFYRILRNSLTDFYRARAAEDRKSRAYLQDRTAAGEDSQAAPDADLMGGVCACLNRLLPSLKPEYADLVRRIDLEGERPAEVARNAGITSNNLTVRLHRARQALRKSLERSCGACTRHGCLDCTCGHGRAGPPPGP